MCQPWWQGHSREVPSAFSNRGAAYYFLGEYEEAIADCTEAIRLDPDLALAYSNRGLAHDDLGV